MVYSKTALPPPPQPLVIPWTFDRSFALHLAQMRLALSDIELSLQAKGFHNSFIVHVCHIHGSFLQCSLHHLVMGIWEPLKNLTCLEALVAFDHLNCQILNQIFLKSNAQEGGHGQFWNWLGHKSWLWGVLGRAWTIDE